MRGDSRAAPTAARPAYLQAAKSVLFWGGVFALSFVILECATRFLLFSRIIEQWGPARHMRNPGRFGSPYSDDLFYSIGYRWIPAERLAARPAWSPYHDARSGWTSNQFAPPDYAHCEEPLIGERQLLLLFGESFASCTSKPDYTCFEQQLRDSRLGERFALLNYGVPGHGLDQTYLLLEPVLDRHLARSPVVILGVTVDESLDRLVLGVRDWPKPRLRAKDDQLVLPSEPVPTLAEYMATGQSVQWSYAAVLLRRTLFPTRGRGTAAQELEKQELASLLLRRIVEDLEGRDLRYVFMIFNGRASAADPAVLGWRQELLRAELGKLAAPYVEVRDGLLVAAEHPGRTLDDFFMPHDYHFSQAGYGVAFASILRGLARLGLDVDPQPLPLWSFGAECDWAGGGVVRYEHDKNAYLGIQDPSERLLLRGADSSPSSACYELGGVWGALRATAWVFAPGGQPAGIDLSVLVDGEEHWSGHLESTAQPTEVAMSIRGAERVTFSVRARSSTSPLACAILSDVFLQ